MSYNLAPTLTFIHDHGIHLVVSFQYVSPKKSNHQNQKFKPEFTLFVLIFNVWSNNKIVPHTFNPSVSEMRPSNGLAYLVKASVSSQECSVC